jgi:hypothetical protein
MESNAFSVIAIVALILAVAAIVMHSSKGERRIRTIERRLALLLDHFGIDPAAHVPPSEQVKQLAADPSKRLQAVRLYCKETGADIKTSAAVIAALPSNRDTT